MARFNECCCRFRCLRLHKQLQGIFLLANTGKISYCTPWGFYGSLLSLIQLFSMKKQLFLQNQSHLPLWNSTESSKSDSNILLSPSSSIPLGICLAVTIGCGEKHGNALIINRLFFTTWEKQHFSTIAQLGRPSYALVKFTGGTARFSVITIIIYWYYTAPKCYREHYPSTHFAHTHAGGRLLFPWALSVQGPD